MIDGKKLDGNAKICYYIAWGVVGVFILVGVVYGILWIMDLFDVINPSNIIGGTLGEALGFGKSTATGAVDTGKDIVSEIPIQDGVGAIGGAIGGVIGGIGGGFGL
jgi:hypothetical protein